MNKNIIIAVMGVVIAIMLFFILRSNKQLVDSNLEILMARQTIDSMVNKNNQLITTQEVIVVNSNKQLKEYTDSIFNLTNKYERRIKSVIAFYKSINHTTITEVLVPYVDSNAVIKWKDSVKAKCSEVISFYESNSVFVPKIAKDSTASYTAMLTAERAGIKINSLSIPDSQYIRFVTLKGGLLKRDQSGKRHLFTKKSIQVQVLHTNSLIHITGENSVIYKPAKKLHIASKAILIGGGILLGTLIK